MTYSRAAVAALCVALASTASAGTTKWVPLNSIKAGSVDELKTPVPAHPVAPAAPPVAAPAAVSISAPKAPIAAMAAVAPGGVNSPLQITCFGGGTANKAAVATAYSGGAFFGMAGTTSVSGVTSGTSTIIGSRQQGFDDQVDVRLFSGDDQIRLPRTILPPIHGGSSGWFKLKDVVADARSIRASAAINFMSNPKIYIDRVTGTISISGRAGDYAGQCQAVEAAAAPKF